MEYYLPIYDLIFINNDLLTLPIGKINEIKVDIILPNYNSDRFLYEAIDSILNQTFKNWKLIVADDNSNLNSKELLKKYYCGPLH